MCKIIMPNYSFLANHFGYKIVNLNEDNKFSNYLKEAYFEYPDSLSQHDMGFVFYEFETDYIFNYGLGNFDKLDLEIFRYYVSLLPELTIENVSYLFVHLGFDQKRIENPFEFLKNSKCKFIQSCFAETYGNIVYRHQLKDLIELAEISDKTNKKLLPKNSDETLDFSRRFNIREAKMFDVFKELFTPTDISIYEILQYSTPIKPNGYADDDFGFLSHHQKTNALEFVKRANKYLPNTNEYTKWTYQQERLLSAAKMGGLISQRNNITH